jgi:hypothetical protein
MPPTQPRIAVRRTLILVGVAGTLVFGLVIYGKLSEYSIAYQLKADTFDRMERSLLRDQTSFGEMEDSARLAAAKFRRGEWGLGEGDAKASYERLMKTVQETQSEELVKHTKEKFFGSMAQENEKSANGYEKLRKGAGAKATFFARLRRKYQQAARAPWWPVEPDPREPN